LSKSIDSFVPSPTSLNVNHAIVQFHEEDLESYSLRQKTPQFYFVTVCNRCFVEHRLLQLFSPLAGVTISLLLGIFKCGGNLNFIVRIGQHVGLFPQEFRIKLCCFIFILFRDRNRFTYSNFYDATFLTKKTDGNFAVRKVPLILERNKITNYF
jgi:hypothetical protein